MQHASHAVQKPVVGAKHTAPAATCMVDGVWAVTLRPSSTTAAARHNASTRRIMTAGELPSGDSANAEGDHIRYIE